MEDELKKRRDRIDAIDAQILKLVSERAGLAHEIGMLKGSGPIYRPEREAQVLRRLQEGNLGPFRRSDQRHFSFGDGGVPCAGKRTIRGFSRAVGHLQRRSGD